MKKAASTGVTDRAVLMQLEHSDFLGSIALLAQRTGTQERYVWTSVAGLAARELVRAQRNGRGLIRITLTTAGRAVLFQLQGQYKRSGYVLRPRT